MLQLAVLIRRPVPDHVVAAVTRTQVIVGAGDRIAQALFARRQAERHVIKQLAMNRRCKRRLGNERAPRHVADVERRQLRQTLLTDGGAKAIRPHQELALGRAAIAEMRDHGVFGLHETADASTPVVTLARERVPQHPVDALPGGENLRTGELANEATGRIQDLSGRDLDPERGWVDSEPAQRFDQIRLRDDAGATAGELALDPLENIDVPAGTPQQQRGQQAAHGAADDQRAPLTRLFARSRHFLPRKSCYISCQTWRNAMARTMLDKQAESSVKSPWPQEIAAEFEREKNNPNPCVGNALVSESDRVRVWTIRLKPGERIGFHRHVLDYFWTAVTGGRGRQHVHDGTTVEYTYAPGETRHETYGPGQFKVHDLENLGDKEMVFMTIEFLQSANKPMPLPAGVRQQAAA